MSRSDYESEGRAFESLRVRHFLIYVSYLGRLLCKRSRWLDVTLPIMPISAVSFAPEHPSRAVLGRRLHRRSGPAAAALAQTLARPA